MQNKIILFVFLILGGIYLTACSSSKEELSSNNSEINKSNNPTFAFTAEENGNSKHYEAEFAGDSIRSLYIDGNKIPDNQVNQYEDLVYEKLGKLHKKRNFSFHFDDSTFDMKNFSDNMKKLKEGIKEGKIKISSNILNKELLKKNLEKAREELAHVKLKKFHIDFNKDDLENEIKNLNDELENLDLNFNIDMNIDVDIDKIKSEIDKAMENIKDVHINIDVLDKDLKKLDSFIDDLKTEMVEDKLIDSKNEKVDVELNSNEMIVNGKKVDNHLLEKYKNMYKEHFGKDLKEKQSFEIH